MCFNFVSHQILNFCLFVQGVHGDVRQILHLLQIWSKDGSGSQTQSDSVTYQEAKARFGIRNKSKGPRD